MFGGVGLFDGDAMFAVVINNAFYFKTDDGNSDDYDALDLPALSFARGTKEIRMSFRQPPDAALDRAEEFGRWMLPALAAAQRAAKKRAKRPAKRQKKSVNRRSK